MDNNINNKYRGSGELLFHCLKCLGYNPNSIETFYSDMMSCKINGKSYVIEILEVEVNSKGMLFSILEDGIEIYRDIYYPSDLWFYKDYLKK